jgi:hypothetical protein
MSGFSVQKTLRNLAKDDYWQNIYSLSKEHPIKFFNNDSDFTDIQYLFLKYLNFYSSLFTDIALGEIDEIVLDNEIYEDSYMMFKNKKDKKNPQINIQNTPLDGKKSKWIFKKPKK